MSGFPTAITGQAESERRFKDDFGFISHGL